jgi:thioredoxin
MRTVSSCLRFIVGFLLLNPGITPLFVSAFSSTFIFLRHSSSPGLLRPVVSGPLFTVPPPSSSAASTTKNKFKNFDELLNAHDQKPILVNFHATYCGPCELLQKELKQVKEALHGKIHVFNIDVERFPSLGTRFKVSSLPTLVVFKNGEIVLRIVGVENTDTIISQLDGFL